jgi:hypothetical protein
MHSTKIYIIFKDNGEHKLGYYYMPYNRKKVKKFHEKPFVSAYVLTDKGLVNYSIDISKDKILKRNYNLKKLKEACPQFFV